jgi:hypothetical protein
MKRMSGCDDTVSTGRVVSLFLRMSCIKPHICFLFNLGYEPLSFIHSHAQDVQEGTIPNQSPRQGGGEKGDKRWYEALAGRMVREAPPEIGLLLRGRTVASNATSG